MKGYTQAEISHNGLAELAGVGIPKPNSAIVAGRSQYQAIGADGNRIHAIVMTAERAPGLPGCAVPNLERLVVAGRSKHRTVGAESKRCDRLSVAPAAA